MDDLCTLTSILDLSSRIQIHSSNCASDHPPGASKDTQVQHVQTDSIIFPRKLILAQGSQEVFTFSQLNKSTTGSHPSTFLSLIPDIHHQALLLLPVAPLHLSYLFTSAHLHCGHDHHSGPSNYYLLPRFLHCLVSNAPHTYSRPPLNAEHTIGKGTLLKEKSDCQLIPFPFLILLVNFFKGLVVTHRI
jgi:hypothetical protein